MNTAPLSQRFKDPFSGLSHAAGLLAAVLGAVVLVSTARRDGSTLAIVCVYSLTLMALYAASSAYHLIRATEKYARGCVAWTIALFSSSSPVPAHPFFMRLSTELVGWSCFASFGRSLSWACLAGSCG
jgi:uncharacterized membrane protein YhhN